MIGEIIVLVTEESTVSIRFGSIRFEIFGAKINVERLFEEQYFQELLIFDVEIADHGSIANFNLF